MMSRTPVPVPLRGVWLREWIEYNDGDRDDTSIVYWMQLESEMADVRFSEDHAELAGRGSLKGCDVEDLVRLAASDSSCGYTTSTPIEWSETEGTATANWFSYEIGCVAFQPSSSYPEPGHLEWCKGNDLLIERAPSGAYVEQWRRLTNPSDGHERSHTMKDCGDYRSHTYIFGPFAIFVADRRPPFEAGAVHLADLVRAAPDIDHARQLVDCEFSLAQTDQDGRFVISGSTHPWRIGDHLDV